MFFLLAVVPYIPQPMFVGWRFRIGCFLLFLFVIVFFLLYRPVIFFLLHRPVIFFCVLSPSRRIQPIYSSWRLCGCVRAPCYTLGSLPPETLVYSLMCISYYFYYYINFLILWVDYYTSLVLPCSYFYCYQPFLFLEVEYSYF